jgi:hypothetical protein
MNAMKKMFNRFKDRRESLPLTSTHTSHDTETSQEGSEDNIYI